MSEDRGADGERETHGNTVNVITELAGSVDEDVVGGGVDDVLVSDAHHLADVVHRVGVLLGEEVGESVVLRPVLTDVVRGTEGRRPVHYGYVTVSRGLGGREWETYQSFLLQRSLQPKR